MSELFERAQAVSRAASTRRCARSRRSAASRSSSTAPRARTSFDTDGNRYVDYVQSWGASILGHAHPAVVEAVQRAAAAGTSYGAPTAREVELAEAIAARVPSVDKVRLVSSGTEAGDDRGAPRPRRDRPREDPEVRRLLPRPRRRAARRRRAAVSPRSGCPVRPASPRAPSPTPIVVPYNDDAALDAAFDRHGAELAAVIVEPVAANMGLVPPGRRLPRPACATAAPRPARSSICDEVITGFRLGPAGAQGRYGITPDLSMFGKVVGGGLPLAAVGGRAEVMDHLAPLGPVYQAGTLVGNPVATAAGLAVLDELDDASYAELETKATRFADGLRRPRRADAARSRRSARSPACSSPTTPVTDYERGPSRRTTPATRSSSTTCSTAGVFLAPSGYETLFVCLAHDDEQIDETLPQPRIARPTPSAEPRPPEFAKHCSNAGWAAGDRAVSRATASRRPAAGDCGARGP